MAGKFTVPLLLFIIITIFIQVKLVQLLKAAILQGPITSVGILYICNLWILLKKIVIYLVGRKFHLRRFFCC